MAEVPKIVYDRLRAALPRRGAPGQLHPDADLLTAFAEQALPTVEREGVLEHLALCGDCREVVTLALPDAGITAARVAIDTEADRAGVSRAGATAPYKKTLTWRSLHWATLTAGVAVVAAVLLVHPANRQIVTPAQPAPASPIASSSVPSSPVGSPSVSSRVITPSSTDQSRVSGQAAAVNPDRARTISELQMSKKLNRQPTPPSVETESRMWLAGTGNQPIRAGKQAAAPDQRVNETVEVGEASEATGVEPSKAGTLMARNDAAPTEAPAIEKAKPAPVETESNELQKMQSPVATDSESPGRTVSSFRSLANSPRATSLVRTPPRSVTLAIRAGVLHRSLDGGQNWQSALHADHPLLCFASHGARMWAGGRAGTLFRSIDSGVTWVRVQPSIKAHQLSADITHIDILGADIRGNGNDDDNDNEISSSVGPRSEITLSTSNNEIWSSADDGNTWENKKK